MARRTLAAAARPSFSANARNRGESYFFGGRVSAIHVDRTSLTARVLGTRVYDVGLTLDGDRLRVECTCPQFLDNLTICKHIWAAILAADEKRAFEAPPGMWVDFEDFDDDVGEWVPDDVAPDLRPAPRAPAPPPAWQVLLSHVTPRPTESLPARVLVTGEILYVLDVARSVAAGCPVVELLARDRKKSGDWAKPKPLNITRDDVARLPDPRDRRILEIACGAAQAYTYAGTAWGYHANVNVPVPQSFALNPTLQRELMPHLCETGRVCVRPAPPPAPSLLADARRFYSRPASPPQAELLPAAWDDEPVEFLLRIAGNADSGYAVAGLLRSGGRERTPADAIVVTAALVLWRPKDAGAPARFAAFDPRGCDRWIPPLFSAGSIDVPASETEALIEALARSDLAPDQCPEDLRVRTVEIVPRPVLRIARRRGEYAYGSGTGARLELLLS